MNYASRLLIAKILITSVILAISASSIQKVLSFQNAKLTAYLNGDQVYFAATLAVITCALAIPLLYLVWAKLHGTGRGVRMAGFITFIIVLAPQVSLYLTQNLMGGDALHDTYYVISFVELHIMALSALALGLLLTIKGKTK